MLRGVYLLRETPTPHHTTQSLILLPVLHVHCSILISNPATVSTQIIVLVSFPLDVFSIGSVDLYFHVVPVYRLHVFCVCVCTCAHARERACECVRVIERE